jgi:hypothetical protein
MSNVHYTYFPFFVIPIFYVGMCWQKPMPLVTLVYPSTMLCNNHSLWRWQQYKPWVFILFTWRNRRSPSPTRNNLSLCRWFCLSVRAKRGIWSKRVLIRKIGSLSFSVLEGILQLFTIFYLHRKCLIFLRNDRDCKAVEGLNIFEKLLWL